MIAITGPIASNRNPYEVRTDYYDNYRAVSPEIEELLEYLRRLELDHARLMELRSIRLGRIGEELVEAERLRRRPRVLRFDPRRACGARPRSRAPRAPPLRGGAPRRSRRERTGRLSPS
jgi:hypothetical protein